MLIASLWVAQLLLFSIGAVGPWRDRDGSRPRLPLRMLLSASLVLSANFIWQHADDATAGYARAAYIGMALSFLGDLLMAKFIPFPNHLIGGMLAFGTAHWMYISAYRAAFAAHGVTVTTPALWSALGIYAVVAVGGWWFLIRNPAKDTVVNVGALIYGSWIGVMASFAFALGAGLGGAWWLAAIGGAVFVCSDFIIGITEIRGVHLENARGWVWATYIAGQMGIIYAPWVAA